MPHCICKPANIKFAIVAPSIMRSHNAYKTYTRTFSILSPSIIRSHSTCKTANIKYAIATPSIMRSHSAYKTGARTFAIVVSCISRPHRTYKKHNIKLALVGPLIIRRFRIPDIQTFRRFRIFSPKRSYPPYRMCCSRREGNSHPVRKEPWMGERSGLRLRRREGSKGRREDKRRKRR